METEQKQPEKSKKLQSVKTSNRNSKPVTEKQINKSFSDLSKTTKPQKGKESVPKQGNKVSLAKSNEKTENKLQSVSKADGNKDGSKKQAKKRNKKSTDPLEQSLPLNNRVNKEGCEEPKKKSEKILAELISKKEEQTIENGDASKKTGSEISKSKKRRIRKKRLLESLGVTIPKSDNTDKNKTSKRKKKKKKSKTIKNSELGNETVVNVSAGLKSESNVDAVVSKRAKDNTEKKGAVKKSEGTVEASSKVNGIKKKLEPKTRETKVEKKIPETNVTEFKGNKILLDRTVPAKETQPIKKQEKELLQPEAKNNLEDTAHQLVNKIKEDTGKVDIVNLLSHDNVEGLFRSALLNDVTLSSHCSEKEVKNFFNTYGTFSDKGRTQLSTVEKLLNSNNRDSEEVSTSQYFELALDKETSSPPLKNLNTVSTNSCDINTLPVATVSVPKCECVSSKLVKESISIEEPLRNTQSEPSYNEVVKGLNTDSVDNHSLFKANLCRGPIYTSSNLENRVTNTSSSSQTPNSTSRVFVSTAYKLHELNHQDSVINSHSFPEKQNSNLNNLFVHENQSSKTSSSKASPDKDSSKKKDFKGESASQGILSGSKKAEEKDSVKFHSIVNLQPSINTAAGNTCEHDKREETEKDTCVNKGKSKKKTGTDNNKDKIVGKSDTSGKIVKCHSSDNKEDTSKKRKETCLKIIDTETRENTSRESEDSRIKPFTDDRKQQSDLKKVCSKENENKNYISTNTNEDLSVEKLYTNKTEKHLNILDPATKKSCTHVESEPCAEQNTINISQDTKGFSYPEERTAFKEDSCPDKNSSSIQFCKTDSVKNFCTHKELVGREAIGTDESTIKYTVSEEIEDISIRGLQVKDTSTENPSRITEKDISSVKNPVNNICTNKEDKSLEQTYSGKEVCLTNSAKKVNFGNKDSSTSKEEKNTNTEKENCIADKYISIAEDNCTYSKSGVVKETFTDAKEDIGPFKDSYTFHEDIRINDTFIEKKDLCELKNTPSEVKFAHRESSLSENNETSVNTSIDKKDTDIKKSASVNEKEDESINIINGDSKSKLCNVGNVSTIHKFEINGTLGAEVHRLTDCKLDSSENTQKSAINSDKTVEPPTSLNQVEIINHSQIAVGEQNFIQKTTSEVESTLHKHLSDSAKKEKEDIAEFVITDSFKTGVPAISILDNSEIASCLPKNITMRASPVKPSAGDSVPKTEKTREEILAEREAKKAAKLAAKNKLKGTSSTLPKADSTQIVSKDMNVAGKNAKQTKSVMCKSNVLPESKEDVPRSNKEVKKEDKSSGNKTDHISQVKISPVSINEGAQSVMGSTTEKTESSTGKSKAELRAERRAIQEAQRAAKGAQQVKAKPVAQVAAETEKTPKKQISTDVTKKTTKVGPLVTTKAKTLEHRVKLFNHLYRERGPLSLSENLMLNGPDLHPAIVKLGMQYADRVIVGSNARCIALLDALKQVIRDYETPPQKEFSRGLEAELQPSIAFLETCRPVSVSMTNALRHLMRQLTQLPNNVSDSEAKKKLLDSIDTYIREQIEVAAQAICFMVRRKIANGDVILTYGCSSLVQRILLESHASGTKFKVIVVDGRPWYEGREMLRRLTEHGLDCSYVLVAAASFIMREATKVLLGAHALLANGYVMSRAGASQVALLAHCYNVPVLVCCETHKFCERVQTDSFVYNELGNPDDLVPATSISKEVHLSKWKTISSLTPLNLTYDVTPPDLVSAVVTELAILPCTSVPVILRIKPTEIGS